MRHVGVGHQETMATDDRASTGGCATVNSGTFANHRVIPYDGNTLFAGEL